MINKYVLTNKKWVAITTAGQNAAVWVNKNIKGSGRVYLNHSDSGNPNSYGIRLFSQTGNSNIREFVADNQNDILYARLLDNNNEVEIYVDVEEV